MLPNLGWYNRSLEAYDAVLAMDTNDSAVLSARADTLYKLHRFNESLQAFDDAIKANPERGSSWKGKGDALKALNRTNEATSAYEMALNLSETAIQIDSKDSAPGSKKVRRSRTSAGLMRRLKLTERP